MSAISASADSPGNKENKLFEQSLSYAICCDVASEHFRISQERFVTFGVPFPTLIISGHCSSDSIHVRVESYILRTDAARTDLSFTEGED